MGNVRALGGHDERSGGFLYRPSTGARDVNELIDPALGYTIAYPQAVNDRQRIVGLGCKELSCRPVLQDPLSHQAETSRGTSIGDAIMKRRELQ